MLMDWHPRRKTMATKQPHAPETHGKPSTPAEVDDEGTRKPAQPANDDQSGSTGRRAVDETQPAGPDTGQGRYGQNDATGEEKPKRSGN
jgi:hypothetical protein